MTGQQWLEVAAIVVPLLAAVIGDGMRTRARIAVVEARQADDRDRMDRHETEWHGVPPAAARARRRA